MIDLEPEQLEIVRSILERHVPECEVRAYGSRVRGKAKKYSDLDLAIVGKEKIDRERMTSLEEAFAESDLPIRVDVLDWWRISNAFREVIEVRRVVLQKKNSTLETEKLSCKS